MKKVFTEPKCDVTRFGCEDIMFASTAWFTHEIGFVTDEDIEKGTGEFGI